MSQSVVGFLRQANDLISVYRPIIFWAGCDGAIFISRLIYWSSTTPDGWFWKTYQQWYDDTSLSKHKIKSLTEKLQGSGVLEVKLKKNENFTPVLYYRINLEQLNNSF